MEALMGPPILPAFSLRVQLFAPDAHASGDKPIRCFRVVTSPDASIRDFCQEASRIHEINYGTPLAVKKCQDDLEFDITQSEIVGHIFASANTIRVIQASSTPNARDSVPPTSALRYESTTSNKRKRDREDTSQANGSPSAWSSKKRQRLPDMDPDQPLPTSEGDIDRNRATPDNSPGSSSKVIPNSQEMGNFAIQNNDPDIRHVRTDVPTVPETPSPSPPPALQNFTNLLNKSTNKQHQKSALSQIPNPSNSRPQQDLASPFLGSSQRLESFAVHAHPQRAKSASYHIERATERGISVSTAATSPLSADQHLPAQNRSDKKRLREEPLSAKPSGNHVSKSLTEDSMYDEITSDNERSTGSARKAKDLLKLRKSPAAGLRGLSWSRQYKTPPNGNRQRSHSHDQAPASGGLPLTPSSKEREGRRQMQRTEEAREARRVAVEAAEEQQREAETARQTEQSRLAEEERKRGEQEKVKAQEDAKRLAIIAKNDRLRAVEEKNEAADRLKKGVQERLEAEILEKAKQLEERKAVEKKLEKERIRKEQAEVEQLEKKKAKTEKLRLEEVAQAEKTRILKEQVELSSKTRTSRSVLNSQNGSSSESKSGTPGSRQQSTTPFIPPGRRSAMSPHAIASSSPSNQKILPDTISRRVEVGAILPLPKPRAVSFAEEPPKPNNVSTPPIIKQTPIPVPRPYYRKQNTVQTTPVPPQRGFSPAPRKSTPHVMVKKFSPIPVSTKPTTALTSAIKEKPKPPPKEPTSQASSEKSEEDEDVSSQTPLTKPTPSESANPTSHTKAVESGSEEEEEDMESKSDRLSQRDSRSPITFNTQPTSQESTKPHKSVSPESAASSEKDDDEAKKSDTHDDDSTEDPREEEDDESEDDKPQSSPDLPPHSAKNKHAPKPNSEPRKPPTNDNPYIQEEVDRQLTSDIYEAARPESTPVIKKITRIVPPRTVTPRPNFNIGTSLSSLLKKSLFRTTTHASSSQEPKIKRSLPVEEDEDESEEESNDEESEEEETMKSKEIVKKAEESSNSSDSDSEDEVPAAIIRAELMAEIQRLKDL
ncbi:hypothetical protein B7494_g4388 [Chlorociboria aeruginascens]|nr:hypothetical protein B7494_g4388 [Chlorociboria aeruginascens]